MQFSLKRLMLAVACFAVFLGLAGWFIRSTHRGYNEIFSGLIVACYGIGTGLGVLTGKWRVGLYAIMASFAVVAIIAGVYISTVVR